MSMREKQRGISGCFLNMIFPCQGFLKFIERAIPCKAERGILYENSQFNHLKEHGRYDFVKVLLTQHGIGM